MLYEQSLNGTPSLLQQSIIPFLRLKGWYSDNFINLLRSNARLDPMNTLKRTFPGTNPDANILNDQIQMIDALGSASLPKPEIPDLTKALGGDPIKNVQDSLTSNPLSSVDTSSSVSPTFSQKFSNSTFGKNFGLWSAGLNMANNLFTGIAGPKSEYEGAKGDITLTMDSTYDAIQGAAGMFGPVGLFVSLGMGANKLLGNVANKLGAGTDGMTTTDAILGSSFLLLTPVGLINGFGGKKADTITKDELAFEQVGSSYGGTQATVNDALTKSGKKYGAFSSGARREANREIAEAKRQQGIMSNIADEATDRFAILGSTAAINENRRAFQMTGGYNPFNIRVGKSGMSLELMAKAKKILHESRKLKEGGLITSTKILLVVPEFLQGGLISASPTEILLVVPEFLQGGSISLRVRDYYKGHNLDGVTVVNDNSPRTEGSTIYSPSDEFTVHELWHYLSLNRPNESLKEFYDSLDDSKLKQFGADLDFVKRTGDPSDFYNPSELEARLKAAKFMSQGLNYTKDFFKNLRSNEALYGDNMRDLLRMFNDDYLEKLFNLDSALKFQEGGSINVIPEGALHARKHNMDMEGITKKGIPVVSDKEGGEVEQLAEIEREEIIFRLEVTKKLEELEKKFYDDDTSQKEKDECALEAGKLLVEEILYNTLDNTGKLI